MGKVPRHLLNVDLFTRTDEHQTPISLAFHLLLHLISAIFIPWH